MRRRFDDEDERPAWGWRLTKGILVGVLVCGAALAAISIYVLPPPSPPPAETVENTGDPKVVDGIEVASQPAYFGAADAGDTTADADAVETGPIELSGPALAANATPFEAAPDRPLLAIVLDDTAADPLLHETIFTLDMPLTVGVVAGEAGDTVTARKARDAGLEVVAELPLVASSEAEGAVIAYGMSRESAAERTILLMRRLPMAVAAARALETPEPPGRDVLAGILEALGPLGFAWLEHGIGPDGAPSVASDGLEQIVAVSRFTIPAGTTAADAHSILDRAATRATESGAAVVFAKAEEPVLLALQLWGGEGAETSVQLAPLSAVIRRQHGGDATDEPASAELEEPAGGEPERTSN